uniref:Sensor histidine kinase n=1 Tax=Desertifilum tharense IPPAS B-1220 TaxID=1781255 RepID=A0ACD5GXT8_9CYAN
MDIHEGIESTLTILHHRLKAKSNTSQIQVIKEYGNLPPVECYPSELNQALMNLLSNSIDAIESCRQSSGAAYQGQIIIQTAIAQSPERVPYVTIRMADNGLGISEAIKHRIFDPFFTTKPVGKGTGLGLSIAYQIIVDKHHGHLECKSRLQQGAEFQIEIPLKQPVI